MAMAAPGHFSEDQKQDEVSNETLQATDTFYMQADLAITNSPLEYSSFQPTAWQNQPSNGVDMTVPRSWETKRVIDNHGPTMFEWYTSPVEPCDVQGQTLAFTSPPGQIMAFQPLQFSNDFQQAPLKFDKSFGWDQALQPSYRAQEINPIAEVMPQLWTGSGILANNLQLSSHSESLERASKRRRRSSTSSIDVRFAPPIVGSTHPSSVEAAGEDEVLGHPSRVPTTTFEVPRDTPPTFEDLSPDPLLQVDNSDEASPLLNGSPPGFTPAVEAAPAPLTRTSASPMLAPSVRVISDRRESSAKLRRGDDTPFRTQSANTKRGHYASEVWESHKHVIKKMYIDEGRPLREVISTMEKEYNFPAT